MMKTTKDRLIQFLAEKNIGQNAFEKKVGIANGYISHNKGSIGSKIISKISSAYPDLNTDWLLNGKGEMLKSEGMESEKSPFDTISIPREVFMQITNLTSAIEKQQSLLAIQQTERSDLLELMKSQQSTIKELQESISELIQKGAAGMENKSSAVK